MHTVIADLHTHTLASSHAYSTITEMAAEAARLGLYALGCTDHGGTIQDAAHPWHFDNLKSLPDRIAGVRVLRGIETNVIDFEGQVDAPDWLLERLEVVVASMHGGVMPKGSVEECTAAYLGVAANPHIDIIGHSGSADYAYDYETVIPAFGRAGKAVEINEATFKVRRASLPNCRRIAELCKQYEVPIVVDSDAHYHENLGRFDNALALLREIDFPPELIVNGSIDNLRAFFVRRNVSL